jgi:glycosyltransferase involved in cell wall biosynthesis
MMKAQLRIIFYPAILNDGIGTYVNGIKDLVGADVKAPRFGLFSLITFLGTPDGYDIVHSPAALVPFNGRGAKVVCTVQDIIPLTEYSDLNYFFKKYLKLRILWSLRVSDHIIFTSVSTQKDVMREFGIKKPFTVIPLAVDSPIQKDFLAPYSFNYFLCVGRRRSHKNLIGVLESFALLDASFGTYLVLVGSKDKYDDNFLQRATALGVNNRVVFTGFLSKDELAAHYKFARALIFISLYEGFGLPILEAMSYGCPVITSNRSSMPEVAGDAAILVDPLNYAAVADAMKLIINDLEFRQQLIDKGQIHSRSFSWERVAHETKKVYSSIV